jgi:hypothetical protein
MRETTGLVAVGCGGHTRRFTRVEGLAIIVRHVILRVLNPRLES